VLAGITYFVDALPGSKCFEIDLGSQDGNFIIIEQGKERDVFLLHRVAGHRSPRGRCIGFA
jgi:hypothetical protein